MQPSVHKINVCKYAGRLGGIISKWLLHCLKLECKSSKMMHNGAVIAENKYTYIAHAITLHVNMLCYLDKGTPSFRRGESGELGKGCPLSLLP